MTNPALAADALTHDDGDLTLRIGLPWMRSLPFSSIRTLLITVDGEPVGPLAVRLGERQVALEELAHEPGWWYVQDRLVVILPATLAPGAHDISVDLTLMVPYLDVGPAGPLIVPVRLAQQLTLTPTTGTPRADATISRDVA